MAACRVFQSPNQTRFFNVPQRSNPAAAAASAPAQIKACSTPASGGDAAVKHYELRVCTNRTCRRSGSLQILELLTSLASPNVSVQSCGCLGRCGLGPNLVILPAELFISHCNTAEHAARLLDLQCGLSNPDNNLEALSLKGQGNKCFESGDTIGAEKLFSQAIELQPSGGLHLLYANRSAARLVNGDIYGALQDAKHAATFAPEWHMPLLRQGEAYLRAEDYHSAEDALKKAVLLNPSVRRSKSYQLCINQLRNMLHSETCK